MKINLKLFLIVPGLFVYSTWLSAQTSNYTGTWVLNLEKSQLESPPPVLTSSVFIIKQDADKFNLTRYHIFGNKKNKMHFIMKADGKTRRIKILFKGKLERHYNYLTATLWRKNFLNIVNYKFGNSQNEFIAGEVFTGHPTNYHNIWVFDREVPKTGQ